MNPNELPPDPKAAIEHLHQLRADRLGRYAECPNGPTAPLLRESVAKARLTADQELPRFDHRIGYRHATDEAPLTPQAIRKLLRRLDEFGATVRPISSRWQLVLERRGSDIPKPELDAVRRGARSIAEYLLGSHRQ